MLALDNRTPYATERAFVRDKTGADHWIVAVKATFTVAPSGQLKLADEQLPPLLAPEYWGEPGLSSLRYESDLVLMKPGTDVLVNGSAYAPQGRAAREVPTRLRVQNVEKPLLVVGPRAFFTAAWGLHATDPKPFEKMPLRYERAYGGTDTADPDPKNHRSDARNPIGVGFATRSAHLHEKLAPSILYLRGDPPKVGPAGYGALASYWSPRRELGGTYDDRWAKEQRPLLPLDWKDEALLCAPRDQRVDQYLHGGETVELVNLTPEGVLRLELPKIYLAFATHFGSDVQEHRSKLVTVILEPDDHRLLLVWQTSLRVPLRMMERLDKTVIKEKRYIR